MAIFFVFWMEFDKTRWFCSWNSDQNCAQNYQGVVGAQGVGGYGGTGGDGVQGVGVCLIWNWPSQYDITFWN